MHLLHLPGGSSVSVGLTQSKWKTKLHVLQHNSSPPTLQTSHWSLCSFRNSAESMDSTVFSSWRSPPSSSDEPHEDSSAVLTLDESADSSEDEVAAEPRFFSPEVSLVCLLFFLRPRAAFDFAFFLLLDVSRFSSSSSPSCPLSRQQSHRLIQESQFEFQKRFSVHRWNWN